MYLNKEKDFRQVLGSKIRALRKIQDKTQMDLARYLGFTSTGAISQVESGAKGMTVKNIAKASQFFGVHPVVLMTPHELTEDQLKVLNSMWTLIRTKTRNSVQESYFQAIKRLLDDV